MQFRLEDVSYSYGSNKKKALDNINVTFKKGMNFLIGKNGSGKSTLINVLNGIYKADGNIYLDNINIKDYKNLKKDVAIIYQFSDNQIFNVTVKEELLYAIKKRSMSVNKANKNIKYYFDLFELDLEILEKNPFKLSGGQKKKIAIITMLILNPKVLILDEPTIGLDVLARKNLLKTINKISKDIIVIIISHNIEEVFKYADFIVELEEAKVKNKLNKYDYFKKEYEKDSFNITGILKLKKLLKLDYDYKITKEEIITLIREKYELY